MALCVRSTASDAITAEFAIDRGTSQPFGVRSADDCNALQGTDLPHAECEAFLVEAAEGGRPTGEAEGRAGADTDLALYLDAAPAWDDMDHQADLSRLLAGLGFRAGSDLLSEWLSAVSDSHDASDHMYGVDDGTSVGIRGESGFDAAYVLQGLDVSVSADEQMADNQLLIG